MNNRIQGHVHNVFLKQYDQLVALIKGGIMLIYDIGPGETIDIIASMNILL